MINRILFTKVEAIGNHFVLIDALQMPESDWQALAMTMCEHHFGVGADGLLVLLPSQTADFRFRMFNPDGTEDACGNGLRCAAAYVHEAGLSRKREFIIEAKGGHHEAEIIPGEGDSTVVRISMGRPSLRPADIPSILDVQQVLDYPLSISGEIFSTTAILVGTPHAVICAPSESFWTALPTASSSIERHHVFPERISVTWCSHESPEQLRIRTWERGVGPTLGCGTGACAALVAANLRGLAGTRALVTSPGGTLEIEWPDRGELFMSGPACILFDGVWTAK